MKHLVRTLAVLLLVQGFPIAASAAQARCGALQESLGKLIERDLPEDKSMEELQDLYSRVIQLSPSEKRELVRGESPAVLSSLWRLHFSTSLKSHSLTENQCELLNQIASTLTPAAYGGEKAQKTREDLEEMVLVAQAIYPQDLFREFFVHMGMSHDPGANVERVCRVLKNPELRSLVCSPEGSD